MPPARQYRRSGYNGAVDREERTSLVKTLAARLGFDRTGVAAAIRPARAPFLVQWLRRGFAGDMDYLHRNLETRTNPAAMLPGAASIIVVALNYHAGPPATETAGPRGRIARYAWGRDYHKVVRKKLRRLVADLRAALTEPFECRICVDTAPIVEREIASAAGIGWIGKNTLVLNRELGSYFVLGEVITTLDLNPDAPATDHCGSCMRCLEACPTRALVEPRVMDARRCISYLTIEHRAEIPPEFRRAIGDWLYGCDICQEVCPFNRRVPRTREPDFAPRPPAPATTPQEVDQWTADDYARLLRGRALKRATLAMWKRNAAIVAANAQHAGPAAP